ncbi:hypothetical protein CQ020_22610 [Arthrobacter sp. MYb23]|uniref:hypothetical protein n=1 Tax=unclassified Arthrobacter TaxID=235627 RepID=UPI000CFAF01D|nr:MULTISPECIES: hypothetical protein [unclassified Arthrobacter]PRB35083.1 hypothetical protein CQ038_22375 [Arthrobacter sp. MYb51]PRB89227.1 hypothetical protein CQ020_22610 [Arthrobacter sp. MYb23]
MNQQHRLPWRRGTSTPVSAGVVGLVATGSAAAHVVAAVSGPAGVMAWWMAAMGAACLSCIAPMAGFPVRRLRPCARQAAPRAASHLLAMSAVMILIHMVLLLGPAGMGSGSGLGSGGGHHGSVHSSAGRGTTSSDHQTSMLTLIGVEFLCLIAASAALRMARTPASPRTSAPPRTTAPPLTPPSPRN